VRHVWQRPVARALLIAVAATVTVGTQAAAMAQLSEAPTVSAPQVAFGPGRVTSTSPKRIPILVTWSASDPDAIHRMHLQMMADGGPWTDVLLQGVPTSFSRALAFGRTFNFRVRATDRQGNTSAWATGTPFDIVAVQENDVTAFSDDWRIASDSRFFGGSARYTTTFRAGATHLFRPAVAMAWIGTKGPGYGSSVVDVDAGEWRYFRSQYAPSRRSQQIIDRFQWSDNYCEDLDVCNHAISIICQASEGHPKCDVDALALLLI
jgi:hypothetical protein